MSTPDPAVTEWVPLAGLAGPPGVNGIDGTEWLYGTGEPAAGGGDDGDLYLQNDGKVWDKQGAAWVYTGISLQGPQGTPGAQGPQGPAGAAGAGVPTWDQVGGSEVYYLLKIMQEAQTPWYYYPKWVHPDEAVPGRLANKSGPGISYATKVTNWDFARERGWFWADQNATNTPVLSSGDCAGFVDTAHATSGSVVNYVRQVAWAVNAPFRRLKRYMTNGTWGSWTNEPQIHGPFSMTITPINAGMETSSGMNHNLGMVPTLILGSLEDASPNNNASCCAWRVVRGNPGMNIYVRNLHATLNASVSFRYICITSV